MVCAVRCSFFPSFAYDEVIEFGLNVLQEDSPLRRKSSSPQLGDSSMQSSPSKSSSKTKFWLVCCNASPSSSNPPTTLLKQATGQRSHVSLSQSWCSLWDHDSIFLQATAFLSCLFCHAETVIQCSNGVEIHHGGCRNVQRQQRRVSCIAPVYACLWCSHWSHWRI